MTTERKSYFRIDTPISEFSSSVKAWPIWIHLSLNDIRIKYRRTYLGPWWLVIGMGISLGLMSLLWSLIFGLDWRLYLNYMMSGIITWYWISSYITQSCDIFTIEYVSLMRSLPTPPSIYILRFVFKGAWLFLHYIPIWVVSALVTMKFPTWWALLLFPLGVFIILVNAVAVSTILGMASARFRDLSPAITAVMTPMLLLTPIIWEPSMLGEHRIIADLNPFTHFVAVIRDPLIGRIPGTLTWLYVSIMTAVNLFISIIIYSKYRKYLVFWI